MHGEFGKGEMIFCKINFVVWLIYYLYEVFCCMVHCDRDEDYEYGDSGGGYGDDDGGGDDDGDGKVVMIRWWWW